MIEPPGVTRARPLSFNQTHQKGHLCFSLEYIGQKKIEPWVYFPKQITSIKSGLPSFWGCLKDQKGLPSLAALRRLQSFPELFFQVCLILLHLSTRAGQFRTMRFLGPLKKKHQVDRAIAGCSHLFSGSLFLQGIGAALNAPRQISQGGIWECPTTNVPTFVLVFTYMGVEKRTESWNLSQTKPILGCSRSLWLATSLL